jgi:DNA-binding response OmpR family regulator
MPPMTMAAAVSGGGLCPTCGGTLRADRLVVDLDSNTVSYDGRRWRVTPKLVEFLFVLNRDWPRMVKDFHLRQSLWGNEAEDRCKTNLAIYACRSRQMLAPFGIDVERLPGKGYRLKMPSETGVQVCRVA